MDMGILSCLVLFFGIIFVVFHTHIDGFESINPELFMIFDGDSVRTVLTSINLFVLRRVFSWVFDTHVLSFCDGYCV